MNFNNHTIIIGKKKEQELKALRKGKIKKELTTVFSSPQLYLCFLCPVSQFYFVVYLPYFLNTSEIYIYTVNVYLLITVNTVKARVLVPWAARSKSQLWVRLEFHLNVCQKCTTWKPQLNTAFLSEYDNGAKELTQDFLRTKTAVTTTATNKHESLLPMKNEGAGLAHMALTKKDEVSCELWPPQKNTHNNDKTSGMSWLKEWLRDQQDATEMTSDNEFIY